MTLWIILIGMTASASLMVVWPILRRSAGKKTAQGAILVYADQLAEVERDRERGLIGEPEAAAARIEISRRILRMDQTEAALAMPARRRAYGVAALSVVFVAGLSAALYDRLGTPELPDQPIAARNAISPDKMSPEELIARLDDALAKHPDDLKGWEIAGPMYMQLGRMDDAVTAYRKAIQLGGASPLRQSGLGEALTAAANGVVTAEARILFEAARQSAPDMPTPRMYLALALSQDGKLDEAAAAWRQIIASGRGYEPWVRIARRELTAIEAQRTGTEPSAAPAPSPQAGPRATPDAEPPLLEGPNREMIETMVAGLAARLEKDGGTVDEWERLMKSYRVLGREADARAAYAKAETAFAARPEDLAAIKSAASDLGLTQ
jgi:cytochrome c-type biogenesis protein CcmH